LVRDLERFFEALEALAKVREQLARLPAS